MEFGKGIEFYKSSGRPTKKPDDEVLLKLYEEHTAPEIAAMYGVKQSTVRSWISEIRKSGTCGFKGSGSQGGRPAKRPDDAELLLLYRDHTATEIADMYGVKPSTVRSWVAKALKSGSPRLTQAFSAGRRMGGRPAKRPDDAELLALYKDRTSTEIAAMYGVTSSTVRSWVSKIRKGE